MDTAYGALRTSYTCRKRIQNTTYTRGEVNSAVGTRMQPCDFIGPTGDGLLHPTQMPRHFITLLGSSPGGLSLLFGFHLRFGFFFSSNPNFNFGVRSRWTLYPLNCLLWSPPSLLRIHATDDDRLNVLCLASSSYVAIFSAPHSFLFTSVLLYLRKIDSS